MSVSAVEQSAINRFRRQLSQQLGNKLEKIVLFGSKARGDDRQHSDIDLLIVCNTDDWRIADTVYAVATEVMLDTDVELSPKVLTSGDYRRMERDETPFLTNVLREGLAV